MPEFGNRKVVETILNKIKSLGKKNGRATAQEPEHEVIRKDSRNPEVHWQHMKHGAGAEQELANACRQRGRDHQRNKGAPAKFKEEKLNRENDSGDRSIECCCHACACPAGQQDLALRGSG